MSCIIKTSTTVPAVATLARLERSHEEPDQAGGAPDGDLCSGGVTRLSFPLDARELGNRASRTGLHRGAHVLVEP